MTEHIYGMRRPLFVKLGAFVYRRRAFVPQWLALAFPPDAIRSRFLRRVVYSMRLSGCVVVPKYEDGPPEGN